MTFGGRSVRVWKEERNRFGDPIYTDEREIHGCIIAPQTSSEVGTMRAATVSTGLTMYAPHGSKLTPHTRVQLDDGTLWNVDGVPGDWTNPIGGGIGMGEQVQLMRVTG